MSGETWRVVLATGEVREVWVKRQPCGRWTAESPAHFGAEDAVTPWAAVLRLALRWTDCPREVLAPGVPTRAEAIEAARREGAEAMRDACAASFAAQAEELSEEAREWDRGSNHALAADCDRRARTARAAAATIRALPLPGDGEVDHTPMAASKAVGCTGTTATWCPVCGDCSCGPRFEGDPDGERTLCDERCPLHASTSPHGEESASGRDEVEAARREGAKAMREAAAGVCRRSCEGCSNLADEAAEDGRSLDSEEWEDMAGVAAECEKAIRALPLPGEVVP